MTRISAQAVIQGHSSLTSPRAYPQASARMTRHSASAPYAALHTHHQHASSAFTASPTVEQISQNSHKFPKNSDSCRCGSEITFAHGNHLRRGYGNQLAMVALASRCPAGRTDRPFLPDRSAMANRNARFRTAMEHHSRHQPVDTDVLCPGADWRGPLRTVAVHIYSEVSWELSDCSRLRPQSQRQSQITR